MRASRRTMQERTKPAQAMELRSLNAVSDRQEMSRDARRSRRAHCGSDPNPRGSLRATRALGKLVGGPASMERRSRLPFTAILLAVLAAGTGIAGAQTDDAGRAIYRLEKGS